MVDLVQVGVVARKGRAESEVAAVAGPEHEDPADAGGQGGGPRAVGSVRGAVYVEALGGGPRGGGGDLRAHPKRAHPEGTFFWKQRPTPSAEARCAQKKSAPTAGKAALGTPAAQQACVTPPPPECTTQEAAAKSQA